MVSCQSASPVAAEQGVAQQQPDGGFTLHARDAVVHGETLRYEPQPHKNTLGYWTNPADWAEWPLRVTRPGTFEVHILQGCGQGQGGSEVRVSLAGDSLTFTVNDTGHFQNFKWRSVGEMVVQKPGRYSLDVRPVKLANQAVMDLREVRLVSIRGGTR